ncbi:hypothetical protein DFH06DRAFT_1345279 [Mycena polygramma]|nr:hypothetical protein DFH06DRAFT_1345279 [Mycena polygramma]
MPKVAKSPAKPRPKPKPILKSPKKKVTSSQFINDEAEESDDGVFVDRPSEGGSPLNNNQEEEDDDFDTMPDYGYESDFINDGDIYEEVSAPKSASITPPPASQSKSGRGRVARVETRSSSPEITPPPSPSKPRGRTSKVVKDESSPPPTVKTKATPTPKRAQKAETKPVPEKDVIELASSDEDLTAMDVDDSMFKKPTGVKHSALPPSLLTRSAASKLGIKVAPVNDVGAREEDSDRETEAHTSSATGAVNRPEATKSKLPFQLPEDMDPAMAK